VYKNRIFLEKSYSARTVWTLINLRGLKTNLNFWKGFERSTKSGDAVVKVMVL
jgi:hypothetical protein